MGMPDEHNLFYFGKRTRYITWDTGYPTEYASGFGHPLGQEEHNVALYGAVKIRQRLDDVLYRELGDLGDGDGGVEADPFQVTQLGQQLLSPLGDALLDGLVKLLLGVKAGFLHDLGRSPDRAGADSSSPCSEQHPAGYFPAILVLLHLLYSFGHLLGLHIVGVLGCSHILAASLRFCCC
jgi:hypothetical protein